MSQFNHEELLIIDVALNEFLWNLGDEQATWEKYGGQDFARNDEDYELISQMIEDTELLSDQVQSCLVELEKEESHV